MTFLWLSVCQLLVQTEKKTEMGVLQSERPVFLSPFVHRRIEVTHPVPTKVFLKLSTDMAILFAPFGRTHPPPPLPPFLLMDYLSPREIAEVTS